MLATWRVAVLGLMKKASPISRSVRPAASRRSTSISRPVNSPGGATVASASEGGLDRRRLDHAPGRLDRRFEGEGAAVRPGGGEAGLVQHGASRRQGPLDVGQDVHPRGRADRHPQGGGRPQQADRFGQSAGSRAR